MVGYEGSFASAVRYYYYRNGCLFRAADWRKETLNHHLLTLLMQLQRAFYPHAINHPGRNRDAIWLLMQV